MIRLLLILLVVAGIPVTAFGQVALTITDGGYYQNVTDTDGKLVVTEITKIFDLRTNSTNPVPPVDPTDPAADAPLGEPDPLPDLTAPENEIHAKLVAAAVKISDPTGGQALALTYSYAIGLLRKDKFTKDQAWTFVPTASDQALKLTSQKDWTAFRDLVAALANSSGGNADKQSALRFFAIVEHALEVSFQNSVPMSMKLMTDVQFSNQTIEASIKPPKAVGAK